MPCGGIFPIMGDNLEAYFASAPGGIPECWYCRKRSPPPDHVLVEWDSFIHGECIRPFLRTEEGMIVVEHEHLIMIKNKDGTIETVQGESWA